MTKLAPYRPTTWHLNIEAPQKALQFYALMAEFKDDPSAFENCHIYTGKSLSGNSAMIKWGTKLRSLPQVIATFFTLPFEKGLPTCGNPRCVNPLHRLPMYTLGEHEAFVSAKTIQKEVRELYQIQAPASLPPATTLDDYVELIKDCIDANALSIPVTAEIIRQYHDEFDIPNAELSDALGVINGDQHTLV